MRSKALQTHFNAEDEIRFGLFPDADLREHTFDGTILTYGNFRGATLDGARFSVRAYRTVFSSASLRGTDMTDSNFFGCTFRHAALCGADLARAKFGNSNLDKANLTDANLTDANLLSATGLTANQLVTAANWRRAAIPQQLRDEAEYLDLVRLRRENGRTLHGTIAGPTGLMKEIIDLPYLEAQETSERVMESAWSSMILAPQVAAFSNPEVHHSNPPSRAVAQQAARAYEDIVRAPKPIATDEISVTAFNSLRGF
jgi:hypothetical protein